MRRFALAVALLVMIAPWVPAQTGGVLPFSTQVGSGVDSIDLATSNIYVRIPIRSKSGAVPAQFALVLNSSAYVANGNWVVSGGLSGTAMETGYELTADVTPNQPCNGYDTDIVYSNFVLVDPTGAHHSFNGITFDVEGCYPPPANPVTASDHSGYSVLFGLLGSTVYDASGNSVPVFTNATRTSETLTDPDGNTLQYSFTPSTGAMSFTDTLGQTVVSGTVHASSTPGSTSSAETYKYTDANGTTQTYTVTYTGKVQRTAFGCSGIGEINTGSTRVYFPTKIALPTASGGASYQIAYEKTPGYPSDVTGRIQSITLPSGGIITYGYSDTSNHNGMNCSSQVVPTITRTVDDNNTNTSSQWTYVSTRSGSSPDNYTVTVTDPTSNQTVYNFSGELQTEAAFYQGAAAGTPLQITLTCYNGSLTNCAAPTSTILYPIAQRDVYTNINSSSPTTGNQIETKYDSYGNLTTIKRYDWGPTLSTQSYISYGQSWNGSSCSAYTSANIYNTPCYIHTANSAGTDFAETKISYNSDGKAASVSRWTGATENTWLTTSFGYGTNGAGPGVLSSITAPDGGITSFGSFQCNKIFPGSITYPVSSVGTEYLTYDSVNGASCVGAVVVADKDVNGKTTSYSYNDPLWRLTEVSHPDGGTISYSYATGTTLPWTTTTTVAVSSSQSFTSTSTLDGLARAVSSQTTDPNSSTGYRNGEIVFNTLGQVVNVYNPYFTTTNGKTTYTYDALGRVTNRQDPEGYNANYIYHGAAKLVQYYPSYFDKQTIYQVDGLGRTVSTCEVTGTAQQGSPSQPAACNLNISGSGFLTTYQYDALNNLTSVTHPSGVVRRYQYDGLSRLTSATDPEVGTSSGYYPITYLYDTQMKGDLYQRVAPSPNQTGACPPNCVTTTYLHDAMHRLTTVEYDDGVTPWKTLTYDQSSNWGASLTNGRGRLTGAFTCPSGTYGLSCGSTAPSSVGEIFSYDTMGRTAFDEQCTPSTCGHSVFSLNYGYDYLGDITSATDGTGITYTNTFNDIGQLSQVETNWLSSTQSGDIASTIKYNAFGEPTSDLLGNGIQESWTYGSDAEPDTYNAGSAYNFDVSFAIAGEYISTSSDSVDGNWNYTYDNFGRLGGSNCSGSSACPYGTASAYTYDYDAEGNRWHQNLTQGQGNNILHTFGAWNHINDGSVSYDSAGEVTNDSSHTYTYDPEGSLTKVDNGATATYVYDAFGRRVSQQNSSGTFEFLFDLQNHPVAKLQSGSRVGGEIWFGRHWGSNTGTEVNFMHSDWLGTGRVWTDLNSNITLTCQSLPFGDLLNCPGSGNNFDDVFASLNYNFDDSIYDSQSRQYNQQQGRWTIPDPAGMAAVDPTNPQTWNRYAYVLNNPMNFVDAWGLDPCAFDACVTAPPPPGPQPSPPNAEEGAGPGDLTVWMEYTARSEELASPVLVDGIFGDFGGGGAANKGQQQPNAPSQQQQSTQPTTQPPQWPSAETCNGWKWDARMLSVVSAGAFLTGQEYIPLFSGTGAAVYWGFYFGFCK